MLPQRCQVVRKTATLVIKFDCSDKFDLCYYGQVNSLWLKSSVVSKWEIKHLWGGNIYFAGDGTRVHGLMKLSEFN